MSISKSMAEVYLNAYAIHLWKEEMMKIIKLKYGNTLSESKITKYLDRKIISQGKNPKCVIVNNYINYEVKTNILEIIDYIEKKKLIIGGGGCLFVQHPEDEEELHVIIRFIAWVKKQRNLFKQERKKYAKGTIEWIMCDLGQNNKKLLNNGLYGCLGCPSFPLYNKFLAESITNGGKQIICTAAATFEQFLGVKFKFNFESEVYTFINRVKSEIYTKFPKGINCDIFYFNDMRYKVRKKLISSCAFPIEPEFEMQLDDVLKGCTDDELVILYYKNNLIEFNKVPHIKAKLKYIMENIEQLRTPELDKMLNPKDPSVPPLKGEIYDEINELYKFYEVFVLYTDPVFDRVRKVMFTDRDKVLYTDTDSTFLALNEWVTFVKTDVLNNSYHIEEVEMNFAIVNVLTYMLGFVIQKGLNNLCFGMNISERWARELFMKNEFYLARIVFTNAKKRYISDAWLQEGVALYDKNGEMGYPEIKGFDFKKAVVKPRVTKYFTDLSIRDILRAETIKVDQIYMKLLQLKASVEDSIDSGSHEFYKQSKVQLIDQYKKPYQLQGIRGVLLWNCIFDTMPIELPSDVDIVPIKVISDKRGRIWLSEKLPEIYDKVHESFWCNSNELIRDMELKVIAIPKHFTEYPDWFYDLIDKEKIVSDILSLYYPIMESLGLTVNTIGKKIHLTNMVDL